MSSQPLGPRASIYFIMGNVLSVGGGAVLSSSSSLDVKQGWIEFPLPSWVFLLRDTVVDQ